MTVRNAIADGIESIGSIVRQDFSVHDALAELHEKLRNIEDVKGLANNPGWVKVKGVLIDNVVAWERQILALSVDTDKNKEQINKLHSLREVCNKLIAIIDTTLAAEKGLVQKTKHYEKIIRDAGLEERQPDIDDLLGDNNGR